MFLSFPFVCVKLNRPRLIIVYCHNKYFNGENFVNDGVKCVSGDLALQLQAPELLNLGGGGGVQANLRKFHCFATHFTSLSCRS